MDTTNTYYSNEFKKTKYGEPVLIRIPTFIQQDVLVIHLVSFVGSKFCYSQINLIFKDTKMTIADLQVLDRLSKGYGTLLMDAALSLAHTKQCKVIDGVLGPGNALQRKRQLGIYKKFGFSIESNSLYLEL